MKKQKGFVGIHVVLAVVVVAAIALAAAVVWHHSHTVYAKNFTW
jgi:hypothetical protein